LQEIKSLKHQFTHIQQQHDQLIEKIKDKQIQLQQVQDATKELDVHLQEGQLQRQKVQHPFKVLVYNIKKYIYQVIRMFLSPYFGLPLC
jgi:uncharacterized protein YoxC